MSHHHPLFAQSHIPNLAFHSSLPSQGTAHGIQGEKNRSSTEVGSFKELNLSYTFNLYIPGMTNSQQQVHALGSFSSCRCHSAMGIQPLLCQPWPSADLSLLHLPGAWQRKATTGSCLKLDYFYITVKKLRVNDKSSQEKQVLMCTSTEKISTAITKVHSERKKKNNKSVGKAAPVCTQFVEHR